jgi:hypothetical protein
MDDLLASIKSMIEGESSGEANSQVGSNLDSAPGMTPQGAGVGVDAPAAPNNALDDGIMDLTQVVSAPQPQAGLEQAGLEPAGLDQASVGQAPDPAQNPISDPNQGAINPLLQGQEQPAQEQAPQAQALQSQAPQAQAPQLQSSEGQIAPQEQMNGQSAQDAASKLDDIFSGMDGDAGLANMGGDIGLPASQVADNLAPDFSSDPMARGLGDPGMDQAPAQAQMQNELQNGLQGQSPLGEASGGMVDPAAIGAPDGMGAGIAEQPVVPLDQGDPQFNGGLEGKAPPQSGVPHPGFPAEAEVPGLNPAMNADIGQQGEQLGQQPQMSGEQPRAELMGGHDPRLENDIAMGQALSQADASLNLSTQQPSFEGQAGQQQMQQMQQQAQMRGVQPGQMPAQVAGGMQGQQGQAPHPGQAPMGQMGHAPVPHSMQQGQQGQMAAQGHMAPQAAMGQVPMGQVQGQMAPQGNMGMPQMGGPPMGGAQGAADMLPVPSGFRPVLPAVHGQGDAPLPGAMGDQLPVEMKNNLEEIVKQLLKPLLRDWLERNLPELLKGVVDEETGKIDPNKW